MTCPWFAFKNLHSKNDMNCVIDEELPSFSPTENIEIVKVRGRNGTLHRHLGTYDSFDYPITLQILNFGDLENVKRWLQGVGKLILCHDPDKYYQATVINSGNPIKFENQMDTFWLFTVVFELQPLKRKVRESEKNLQTGKNIFTNSGTEKSLPRLLIKTSGEGDIEISAKNGIFKVISPPSGEIEIDSDLGTVVDKDGLFVKNSGKYPQIFPGKNEIVLSTNRTIISASILLRSLYR